MNIQLIIALLSSLLFVSPDRSEEVLVAQFSIYVDANDFKDGNVELLFSSKIDKGVYRNDCQALYDLCTHSSTLCDPEELEGIKRILEELNNEPPVDKYGINKL